MVTHINQPISIDQRTLESYAGTYRNKKTGSVVVVKRERGHIVSNRTTATIEPEYPYTDHAFYFLNHRGQTDSFVTDSRGLATEVIHHESGKPDEVLDRVNTAIAQD